MKRKAYYVQKPCGELVKDGDAAIPFRTLSEAKKAAREVLGIIGYWDWLNGNFVPRKRA